MSTDMAEVGGVVCTVKQVVQVAVETERFDLIGKIARHNPCRHETAYEKIDV